MMQDSQVKTATIPGTGPNSQAALIAYATAVPMRVMIDNVGATPVRLAFASSSLGSATADGADHYQLAVGASRVFVLAPKQRFFAVSVGAPGRISIHTSDALPLEH